MNYDKKRIRQNGRQKRKGCGAVYSIWIDEAGKIGATKTNIKGSSRHWEGWSHVPMKSMTQEEFRRDYEGTWEANEVVSVMPGYAAEHT